MYFIFSILIFLINCFSFVFFYSRILEIEKDLDNIYTKDFNIFVDVKKRR